jgi:hypothetical protein
MLHVMGLQVGSGVGPAPQLVQLGTGDIAVRFGSKPPEWLLAGLKARLPGSYHWDRAAQQWVFPARYMVALELWAHDQYGGRHAALCIKVERFPPPPGRLA